MIKVENFRVYSLYKRSLDLTFAVYQFLECHRDSIEKQETYRLRKTAISIPQKISSAIGQVNMNIRFKQLNEVKDDFLPLIDSKIQKIVEKYGLDPSEMEIVDGYSLQVLKLIKAHLARLSKEKAVES